MFDQITPCESSFAIRHSVPRLYCGWSCCKYGPSVRHCPANIYSNTITPLVGNTNSVDTLKNHENTGVSRQCTAALGPLTMCSLIRPGYSLFIH